MLALTVLVLLGVDGGTALPRVKLVHAGEAPPFVRANLEKRGVVVVGTETSKAKVYQAEIAWVADAALAERLRDVPGLEAARVVPWKGARGPFDVVVTTPRALDVSGMVQAGDAPDLFRLDRTEVTAGQYAGCVQAGACPAAATGPGFNAGKKDRANHPINGVSWEAANAYCLWRGKELPPEREARLTLGFPGAGVVARPCEYLVAAGCSDGGTAPVCTKPAEHSGTCDAWGNVQEWTRDQTAIGGSFATTVEAAEPTSRQVPLEGAVDVGFRCAAWR